MARTFTIQLPYGATPVDVIQALRGEPDTLEWMERPYWVWSSRDDQLASRVRVSLYDRREALGSDDDREAAIRTLVALMVHQ